MLSSTFLFSPVQAFPVIHCIPCQIQLLVCLGFPHPILHNQAVSLNSAQVTCTLFTDGAFSSCFQFNQQVSTHLWWCLAFLALFLSPWDGSFLCSMESILRDLSAFFCSLRAISQGSSAAQRAVFQRDLLTSFMNPCKCFFLKIQDPDFSGKPCSSVLII